MIRQEDEELIDKVHHRIMLQMHGGGGGVMSPRLTWKMVLKRDKGLNCCVSELHFMAAYGCAYICCVVI